MASRDKYLLIRERRFLVAVWRSLSAHPVEGKAVLITSPIDRSTVAGSVSIVLKLGSQTHQANVFIDGVYLASTPPSDLSWGTTKVANGIHEIDAETFNSSGTYLGFDDIVVITNNPTPTRTPTKTPTHTPTPTPTRTPTLVGPFTGHVMGRLSPISGASVRLYAMGYTGYGWAPTC